MELVGRRPEHCRRAVQAPQRQVAAAVRAFGFVFMGVRWLFWALLWLPTQVFQKLYNAIAAVYPALLRWSLQHRAAVLVSALLIFIGSMALVPRLGSELIPQLSQGEFNVDLRLSPGATLAETDRAIQAAQRATGNIDAVALDYSVAGTGNRLDANPVDAGDNTGTLSVALAPGAGREAEAVSTELLSRGVPAARAASASFRCFSIMRWMAVKRPSNGIRVLS